MSKKKPRRVEAPKVISAAPPPPVSLWDRAVKLFLAPQPIARLEVIRILVPLCILAFMSSRMLHAEDWIGQNGFHIPPLGREDYRQPLYLAPLPVWAVWTVVATMIVSGLMASAGAFTRVATLVFATTLFYASLADRLATFTVTKFGTVLMISLFFTPSGARWSVDSWRRRRDPDWPLPTHVSAWVVRYFQLLMVIFYCSSGIAKARGSWLSNPAVIWTHMHDSYQTWVTYWLGKITPRWGYGVFQGFTLAFECLAPIWFSNRYTRPFALAFGLAMHFMIGIMFGPVIWFSTLMMSLLLACFAPAGWLRRVLDRELFRSSPSAAPPPV